MAKLYKENQWDFIFTDLIQEYKHLQDEIDAWWPSGQLEITVVLYNGERYIYDMISKRLTNINSIMYSETEEFDEDKCRQIFSYRLGYMMRVRGVSHTQLSERTGISYVMISRYLNGKSTPSMYNIHKIARILKCRETELIEYNISDYQ